MKFFQYSIITCLSLQEIRFINVGCEEVVLMASIKIVFDKAAKKEVLSLLNKVENANGLIVEKDKPSQSVLTFEGEEINVDQFGGVQKGSEVFIKNNLVSLIRLSKR